MFKKEKESLIEVFYCDDFHEELLSKIDSANQLFENASTHEEIEYAMKMQDLAEQEYSAYIFYQKKIINQCQS